MLVSFQAYHWDSTVSAITLSWFSGLYYKTITIVIMTIISDATIWSVTLTIVIMMRLAKARIVNYDRL